MRMILPMFMAAGLALIACGPKNGSPASREAASVAGNWSVFTSDTKVNSYHLSLAPKSGAIVAMKIYDEDVSMGSLQAKKGESEVFATFAITAKKIDGQLKAGGKLTGSVHDDGQGITLHSDKGDWELRRAK